MQATVTFKLRLQAFFSVLSEVADTSASAELNQLILILTWPLYAPLNVTMTMNWPMASDWTQ